MQDAIARFSALGTITGQHVAVADLQDGFDAATRRIESLRHSLALIEVRLAAPKLSPVRSVTLLAQQERARHALAGAKETASDLAARGAFARIDLAFATAPAHHAAVVRRPGRLEHAFRRAGGMLETAGHRRDLRARARRPRAARARARAARGPPRPAPAASTRLLERT